MTAIFDDLQDALKEYNAKFDYDDENRTWCMYGTNYLGDYWETDDFEADSLEDAYYDALAYLEDYEG